MGCDYLYLDASLDCQRHVGHVSDRIWYNVQEAGQVTVTIPIVFNKNGRYVMRGGSVRHLIAACRGLLFCGNKLSRNRQ